VCALLPARACSRTCLEIEWEREEPALPVRCAHAAAKFLIGVIVGTQRVAVSHEHALAIQLSDDRVLQQAAATAIAELAADQEIRLPWMTKHATPLDVSPRSASTMRVFSGFGSSSPTTLRTDRRDVQRFPRWRRTYAGSRRTARPPAARWRRGERPRQTGGPCSIRRTKVPAWLYVGGGDVPDGGAPEGDVTGVVHSAVARCRPARLRKRHDRAIHRGTWAELVAPPSSTFSMTMAFSGASDLNGPIAPVATTPILSSHVHAVRYSPEHRNNPSA